MCVGHRPGPLPRSFPQPQPNFLTKQQGMIYVISQVLLPVEVYNTAIAGAGLSGAYTAATGCPP